MVNGLLIGVNQIAVAIRRICGNQYKLIRVTGKPSEDFEWMAIFGIVKIVTLFNKPNNRILYFCYPKIQLSPYPPIPFQWYFGIFCLEAFSHKTDCLFRKNRLKPRNTARFMKRK